jgi:hypothetical protein
MSPLAHEVLPMLPNKSMRLFYETRDRLGWGRNLPLSLSRLWQQALTDRAST